MVDSGNPAPRGHPVVSIILPTYNRPDYLAAAIESVYRQSFRDWELLIADDGSDPQTLDYLQAQSDPPRVKLLRLSHSGNPPAVRNAALLEAQGEFIAFLDSDDVWMPDKLQKQLDSLRCHGGRPWSYTGFIQVGDGGKPLPGIRAASFPAIEGRIFDQLVREQARVAQSSVMVSRELLRRVGGYDEQLPVCGDYELWLRLAQRCDIDCIAEPLVLVRRHRQHYADDVTALLDLERTLRKLRLSGAPSHLNAVLSERRAKLAANLAQAYARCNRRTRVLGTLSSSLWYSWRYPGWWLNALTAIARAFAPAAALKVARKYRGGARHENTA
jgi:glycosyltransferase involved in cell wall biosynthesis